MPDYIYNLYEAKTHLSQLIDRVQKAIEILIAKSGILLRQTRSAAKVESQTQTRRLGGEDSHL